MVSAVKQTSPATLRSCHHDHWLAQGARSHITPTTWPQMRQIHRSAVAPQEEQLVEWAWGCEQYLRSGGEPCGMYEVATVAVMGDS